MKKKETNIRMLITTEDDQFIPAELLDDLIVYSNVEFTSNPEDGVEVTKVLIDKVLETDYGIDVIDNLPKKIHDRLVEIVKTKVEESPTDYITGTVSFL